MRINKLCKRVLAVTLAAALALGMPIALGPKTAEAFSTEGNVVEMINDDVIELHAPNWWLPQNGATTSDSITGSSYEIYVMPEAGNPSFTTYVCAAGDEASSKKPKQLMINSDLGRAYGDVGAEEWDSKLVSSTGEISFIEDHIYKISITKNDTSVKVEFADQEPDQTDNKFDVTLTDSDFAKSELTTFIGAQFCSIYVSKKKESLEPLKLGVLEIADTFGKSTEQKNSLTLKYAPYATVPEKITGKKFNVVYEFDNKSTGKLLPLGLGGTMPAENATNWDNFILQVSNDENFNEVAGFRADRCVDGDWLDSTFTSDAPDWSTWLADMQAGAHVTVNLVRNEDTLYVTYKFVVEKSGNVYNMSCVATGDKLNDTLYTRLTGQDCELENIKAYPIQNMPVELSSNGTVQIKASDILPVESVNVPQEVGEDADPAVVGGVAVDSDAVGATVGTDNDTITIKALKPGTATVTVTDSVSKLSFSCKVTVSDIAATGIKLSDTEVTLKKGETKTVTADPEPESVTDKTVSWVSSDEKVATVADGTITAVGAGTATITATIGAASATITVTVTDDTEKPEETEKPGTTDTPGGSTTGSSISVESVALDKIADELEIGASTTLTATVTPDNATDKDVTWSSSDAKVATVDATGKVTAVAAGTATITVTSKSNEKATATCTITVKAPASTDNNDNNDNNNDNTGNNTGNTDVNTGNGNDNNDANTGNDQTDDAKEPEATTATVNNSGVKETVKTTENGTATVTKVKSSKKSVTVSSTVKVNGVKYKVTAVAANAFAKCKNVTKVTLPATIKTFKKKAFTGAKKVKTIVVKSKKAITVKKGAFKGVNTKKMTIKAGKMSKKQLKKFKKSLKKAGFQGKVKK